jgi:uncharacterized membrane protein YkvA (DUF1232 family)
MHRACERAARREPDEIAVAARAAVARLSSGVRSPFVAKRMHKVNALIGMLEDPEWQLPEPERRRVLDGLAYVADTHDLVPDSVPVLGLLDDAIMLELVLQELKHELEGYEEFDEYRRREAAQRAAEGSHMAVSRADWLESKRQALHDRIRARRDRDLSQRGAGFGLITRF